MPHPNAPCDFDLVIVGASFAGAACAIAAAQRGLRVCILERKHDPGSKLHMTGIIVKEAAERTLLHRVPAQMTRRVAQVRLYAPSLKQVALAAPGYYFLTTDTPQVMRWLTEQMRGHGVDLRLGCAFTGAQRLAEGWQVDGVGRAAYLVGADGARSRVARHCGLGEVRQFLYGIEYEFPGATLSDPGALHCFISKRYAPGYIGWIAQSPTGVQAGLALRHDPFRARVPDIDGFLMRVGQAGGLPRHLKPGHTRAGLIPCSGPVADMTRDRAILIGDAAGIVSPVTAGGIHSAWEHGGAVGRAVAARLLDDGPAPEGEAVRAAPRFRTKRRCAGPSITCSSTGRSTCCCTRRRCAGPRSRCTSTRDGREETASARPCLHGRTPSLPPRRARVDSDGGRGGHPARSVRTGETLRRCGARCRPKRPSPR